MLVPMETDHQPTTSRIITSTSTDKLNKNMIGYSHSKIGSIVKGMI